MTSNLTNITANMTNPTPNLTNLAKTCQILKYPIKSYQILPNPSNLTKSFQILAILPSVTKSYQPDIESYKYYIEYDESYTEYYQSHQMPNPTISHQIISNPSKSFQPYKILSNLSHITLYYQVLLT